MSWSGGNTESFMEKELQIKHISVRVPWHDSGWDGTVCKKPKENASCIFLARINELKNEGLEETLSGKEMRKVNKGDLPPCVKERVSFMCPHEIDTTMIHPYSLTNEDYKHFKETPLKIKTYSFAAVPYRWMMKNKRDQSSDLAKTYNLPYNIDLEPTLPFKTGWIQDYRNQRVFLDAFFSAIIPGKSLCFIYAKHIPLSDQHDRILIGVGRVLGKGSPVEYDYSQKKARRCLIWDTLIQHSIRNSYLDGFILPYQELLEKSKNDPSIELDSLVAPASNREQFSYGSEHVTHDVAIDALLSLASSIRKISLVLNRSYDKQLRWIDERMSELWRLRGPYPGLGAVLSAFGVEEGNFVAWEISKQIEQKTK
ncbi:RNA helicase, partial [Candidatus Omnitrophota bacterium]